MKLPNGNQTPPPLPTEPVPGKNGRPTDPSSRPSTTDTAPPSTRVTASGEQTGREKDSAVLSPRALLNRLKLENNQQVLARVADIQANTAGRGGQLLLDIRGQQLLVQASVGETSLQTGDWIRLMRAGNELQLMNKLAPAQDARIAQALAQHLPWQQRLDTGLSRLMSALNGQPGMPPAAAGSAPSSPGAATPLSGLAPPPLPQPVQQAISDLFNRLPGATQFQTPENRDALGSQVRQWLSESGLFAESRLARNPDPALPDLKLALGRIVTSLLASQGQGPEQFNQYTPLTSHELVQSPLQFPSFQQGPLPVSNSEPPPTVGQMLRLLAGMLNRISVNQLHSQALATRGGGEGAPASATWLTELPWVTPQNEPRIAQLRLERHDDPDSEAKRREHRTTASEWRFTLAMTLDELGPLCFEVSLQELQVSARVWADRQQTLQTVQRELESLRSNLSRLGLEVINVECRRGTPQGVATRLEQRLVDTRA